MGQVYKTFIGEDIKQEKLRDKYGKKYELKTEMEYQYQYKSTKIDITFTADHKAFWMFKYKGNYYMNIIEEIELKDKYTVIDLYVTLAENAVETWNHLTGLQKERRKVLARIAKNKKK